MLQTILLATTIALAAPGVLRAAAPDTAAVRAAAFEVRAGLQHAAASRADAAAAAYARAVARVPAFEPWSLALSATAAARTGDTAAVRRLLGRTDSVIAREWGWRARVDAMLARGDTSGGARTADHAAALVVDPARRAEAYTRAGALHARAGRPAAAAAAYRNAIGASIGSAAAVESARSLGTMAGIGPDDRLLIGRVYLRHGNATRAAEAIDAYIAAASPGAVQRAALQLDLGRALFNARSYAAAERRLRGASAAAAGVQAARESGADALHLLGRAQYRQGRNADARATFVRVTREFAGTDAAARSHYIIADIDHDAGRIESARTHYRAVLEVNGPDLALSAMRLGSLALVEGRAADAARLFAGARSRVQSPAQVQQLTFWWARSLDRAGARDSALIVLADARRIDPFSYYGLRAAELLGSTAWDLAASQPAPLPAGLRGDVAAGIDVVDVLRDSGLEEAAGLEAARLLERFTGVDGALYTLGAAYHERGQTFSGIRVGRDLLRREGSWNRQLLQLVYPLPFRDAVLREARANNLDPFLVAGLIRQESMFNPRARSAAGALGLMQVMPATGTRVAQATGIRSFRATQLTDPAINLRLGTRYLADQIRGHGGRLVDAIAAYNAGPQRVTRWREFPEYRDAELFTERIPYEETREYVKIVQQNARIYRELYGEAGRF